MKSYAAVNEGDTDDRPRAAFRDDTHLHTTVAFHCDGRLDDDRRLLVHPFDRVNQRLAVRRTEIFVGGVLPDPCQVLGFDRFFGCRGLRQIYQLGKGSGGVTTRTERGHIGDGIRRAIRVGEGDRGNGHDKRQERRSAADHIFTLA